MKYNFDTVYQRDNSEKWMELQRKFGASDLLSFWEADMDFKTAQPIIDGLVRRAQEGIYGYPAKSPTYFNAIAQWFQRYHGWEIPEEWMLHTPMAMTAVSFYIEAVTKPGDGIILQTPMYYPFYSTIEHMGRTIMRNPLCERDGRFEMDLEHLETLLKEGGKLAVLCNPHNPTGRVWTREEMTRLGQLCLDYGAYVIADEVHCDFVWPGHQYTPYASLSPQFAQRCMTILSPGKTFNLAGTKQAIAVIANESVRAQVMAHAELLDIDRNNCFSLVATEIAYRDGREWFEQVRDYIQANMEMASAFCKERIPQIRAEVPEGTYLMWLDCRKLGLSALDLNRFMVEQAKVGFGEGFWFGPEGEGFERCTAACPRSILYQGLERIEHAVKLLSH